VSTTRFRHDRLTNPPFRAQVVAATVLVNVLSLALPIVILQIYDRVVPNDSRHTLLFLLSGLLAVIVVNAVLQIVRSQITSWDAARCEHVNAGMAFDWLLAGDLADLERRSPGEHLSQFQAIETLREHHSSQARLAFIDLPFVLIFLGLIAVIAGDLVFLPLLQLVGMAVAVVGAGVDLRAALAAKEQVDGRRYSYLLEVLRGFETMKLMAMESLMERRYERLQAAVAAVSYRTILLHNTVQGLASFFAKTVIVSVVGLGAFKVMSGEMTVGGLAACMLLASQCVQAPMRALSAWTQLEKSKGASEQAARVFGVEPETQAALPEMEPIDGRIELVNVFFGYAEERPVLSGVDLAIKPGEFIGISGGSGTGKSTLLLLMMGLLKPTLGQVLVDGVDIAERNPASLRRQVAYLSQQDVLFQGTILDNLTMFGHGEALEKALSSARLLGLQEVVHRLPAGYHTAIGDGAEADISIGIKQGIAVARALAGDPRVVLFDEANGGLDTAADALLRSALESLKGRKTVVLVSHRPSLLALADRIYDLRDGHLVRRTADDAPAVAGAPALADPASESAPRPQAAS